MKSSMKGIYLSSLSMLSQSRVQCVGLGVGVISLLNPIHRATPRAISPAQTSPAKTNTTMYVSGFKSWIITSPSLSLRRGVVGDAPIHGLYVPIQIHFIFQVGIMRVRTVQH